VLVARVMGTVVASRKEQELEGLKFLLLQMTDPKGTPQGGFVVAADAVGAGVGDLVLYAAGSSARQTTVTKDRPIDATVMAIVDLIDERGKLAYNKASD
jgi:microcompartment protein CcmK/EutM